MQTVGELFLFQTNGCDDDFPKTVLRNVLHDHYLSFLVLFRERFKYSLVVTFHSGELSLLLKMSSCGFQTLFNNSIPYDTDTIYTRYNGLFTLPSDLRNLKLISFLFFFFTLSSDYRNRVTEPRDWLLSERKYVFMFTQWLDTVFRVFCFTFSIVFWQKIIYSTHVLCL